VLVTGTAGTGKTSVAAHFAAAACARGEKCLYFAFEEAPAQIIRNMRSIGLDLEPWSKKGLLRFHATRATMHGLEMHLATIHKLMQVFRPQVVVFDPVSTLVRAGAAEDAAAMVTRLIDFLKLQEVTALLTTVSSSSEGLEQTTADISSLVDTWLLLRDIELAGERNRALYVLKSRGMAHSNQLREFRLTDKGIELTDVYLGTDGVLTGSMRLAQEARETAAALVRKEQVEARKRAREQKREVLEARIFAMRKEFEAEEREIEQLLEQDQAREKMLQGDREEMARSRQADLDADARPGNRSGGTT
jgi:circadian clock protein KaiC